MRFLLRFLVVLAAALAGATGAHAQEGRIDYSLMSSPSGLKLQAGRNWFGQVGLSPSAPGSLAHPAGAELVNIGGGYRFGGGESLSLELSRGFGPSQRLGLAVNYDWPRYFVRFSYDPQKFSLTPLENLRVSAGVRF
jgi:hypothetical protein